MKSCIISKRLISFISEMPIFCKKEVGICRNTKLCRKNSPNGWSRKKRLAPFVIDTVKASCKAAGIDISLFVDQLADYIDQTITFVNGMKKASTK